MAARRKQTAIDIPASRAEAEALVRDYARLEHEAGHVRGIADRLIADAKASRDASLAEIDARQAKIFARLKGWWEAAGKDEAKGKRSIDVDGTQIGVRLTTPKLAILGGMKAADALKWLAERAPRFIRTKQEIDKELLIRTLRADEASLGKAVVAQQFAVTQKDEFFVSVAPIERPAEQPLPR